MKWRFVTLLSALCVSSVIISSAIAATRRAKNAMVRLHIDSFTVVGIEARTSNTREQTTEAVIPNMWKRLMDEDVLNRIPNRVDSRIIAVYSNYENGKAGLYTYLLGTQVSSTDHVPAGMVSRNVPSGTYGVFTAKGDVSPQAIMGLWKQIWSLETHGGARLRRAYKTDFEVYSRAPAGSPEARVDIYIGLLRK